jgi:hypothetical protein
LWIQKGSNWLRTTQSSNQSLTLEPGTEFLDTETAARIRHIRRDFSGRDRTSRRI